MALIKKKKIPEAEIPTVSQADIAFLLLLFFMATSTMDTEKGLGIILPPEGGTMEVAKKNITNLVIDPRGKVLLDNREIEISDIKKTVQALTSQNPKMIISVKSHPLTKYSVYVKVLDQLKMADARRISIAE